MISPYTPSHDGACTVASMAYTASNEFSPNCSESFMKSPTVYVTRLDRPAFAVSVRARPTWNSLLFRPTICTSANCAISRAGPPMPQPTSSTRMPGLRFICEAR